MRPARDASTPAAGPPGAVSPAATSTWSRDAPHIAARAAPTRSVLAISGDERFADHAEVRIAHRGGVCRLQQTALGKLILTT